MDLFKKLMAKQLGQNYQDRSARGRGNHAARRAFITELKVNKFLRSDLNEPIAQYPHCIIRGSILTDCCFSAATATFSHYSR
jgi:hypothetical protein